MIKFLRLIQGYVMFEASGGFTERFLNLCKNNGLNLWGVKNDGVKVVAFTSAAEYKRITIPAEKSGMEINLIKTYGLPFFVTRHKWRCGALLGIVLVVALMWIASGFLWDVETTSNDGVKIEHFTEALADMGVKVGARKSKIDVLKVQEQLLDTFSELSWVSINIFGTKAQVEYTYAKKQQPIKDMVTLTNVVAKKNGLVTLVEGYSGENMVSKGTYVVKGSLLISGVTENADLTESFVHASGRVYAQTENEIKKFIEQKKKRYVVSADTSLYKLAFFGLEIPFGQSKDAMQKVETNILLKGNNTILPLGFKRVDYLSVTQSQVVFSDSQVKLWSLLSCVKEKREEYAAAELKKVSYATDKKDETLGTIMKITCVEDIAIERQVSVE